MHLAILGASGHGKVIADAAEQLGWHSVTFFDDAWHPPEVNGPWEVRGDTKALLEKLSAFNGVVVGIGSNRIRAEKQAVLAKAGGNLVSIVHPSAVVSPYASIGAGSVVFANAVVNPCSMIGIGAIVNTGAVVEHDCVIGDFAHISPNAVLAGGAALGDEVWIGACASVRQMITIGRASIVGMGAVVTKDVGSDVTVVGSPARIRSS
ncbi:acetyltransferase [Marinobacter bohaiensis]|uniref:acetyltransferase n=1 Tax=Marinobacter bohaiensis TaxID=2201898 RepID=UPI00195517AD|nr:acetyltransferase [Marinobacter bohaiensis]